MLTDRRLYEIKYADHGIPPPSSFLFSQEFSLINPPVYFPGMFFSEMNVQLRTGRPVSPTIHLLRRVENRTLPVTYSIVLKILENPGTVPGKVKTV